MSFDDSLVVLGCALLAVGRSKETLVWLHAVVVPLLSREGDECVSKEFADVCVVGAAATLFRQGRAIPARNVRLSREFDPTRGFPGQDILSCLSDFNTRPSRQDAAHLVFFNLLFFGVFSWMVLWRYSVFGCALSLLLLFTLIYFVVLLVEELAQRQQQEILLPSACGCSISLMMSPLFYFCSGSFQFFYGFSPSAVVRILLSAFVCGLTSLLLCVWSYLSRYLDEARLRRCQQQASLTYTCCDTASSMSPWFCSSGSLLVVWLFWRFPCGLLLPEFCARSVSGPRWHSAIEIIFLASPCSRFLLRCLALFLVVVVFFFFFFFFHGHRFLNTLSGVCASDVTDPFSLISLCGPEHRPKPILVR